MERDVRLVLPHAGNALFIRNVADGGGAEFVCTGEIPPGSPFVCEGEVPGFVLLEFAAQAAALEMLTRKESVHPRPSLGYLARVNGLRWNVERVPAGSLLEVRVRREDSLPPLYAYHARVTRDGDEIFQGRFGIYFEETAS